MKTIKTHNITDMTEGQLDALLGIENTGDDFDPYRTTYNYATDVPSKDLGQVSRRINQIARRAWDRDLTWRELGTVRYAYCAAHGLPRPAALPKSSDGHLSSPRTRREWNAVESL